MPKRKRRKRRKNPITKTFLIKFFVVVFSASVLFAVLAVFAVFYFYRADGGGVEMVIDLPEEEITRGIPFDVEVGVINGTAGIISSTNITLWLGDGLVHLGSGAEQGALKENVGDVGPGSLARRTFKVLPVGAVGNEHEIQAEISYNFGRTPFQERKKELVKIINDSVVLSIESPEQIVGGSSLELQVKYKNVGNLDLNDIQLEMIYPPSFDFRSAGMEPDSLNNVWRLGSLMSDSEGSLVINGVMGSESGNFNVQAFLRADFAGEKATIADEKITLNVLSSPLGLDARIFGVPGIGDSIRYVINYSNKSGVDLRDVTITADLISELFDFTSLNTNGIFNPASNRVVWDKRTLSDLELVNSGAGGNVELEISLLSSFPITRLSDKNFVLRIDVEMESPSVPFYLDAERLVAQFVLETKVPGLIEVESKAFYRDASSGVVNSGLLPPAVGKATRYTIHWEIRNHATDVRNIEIIASLPRGVSWVEVVNSDLDVSPIYKEELGKVTWTIPEISATRGIISEPIRAVFQIEAVPEPGMVGQFQPLLTATTLTATDNWSGHPLSGFSSPLDTRLFYDFTVGDREGIVVE